MKDVSVIATAKRHLQGRWYRHVKMPFYGLVASRWPDSKIGKKCLLNRRHTFHRGLAGSVRDRTETYDVVLFGIIEWHSHIQRPQQLCRQFARMGYRVFYVEPFIHSTPDVQLLERGYSLVGSPEPDIFLCQLHSSLPRPDVNRSPMSAALRSELARGIGNLRRAHRVERFVSLVEHPFWRPLAESLSGSCLVYDRLDHLAGFSRTTPEMEQEEARLLAAANLVLTTSAALAEKTAPFARSVLVRNGADFSFFSRKPASIKRPSARPVAGYYGSIDDWFDMSLVLAAARALPEWDFWLIGPATRANLTAAKGTPNVLLAGKVPYAELPTHLYGMDVCMIPFLENELTRCTNPVKVYEYLAAGKPVVATSMPELELMREHVHIGRSKAEFIAALRAAMFNPGTPEQIRRRVEWAASQDWSVRARQIDWEIGQFLAHADRQKEGQPPHRPWCPEDRRCPAVSRGDEQRVFRTQDAA